MHFLLKSQHQSLRDHSRDMSTSNDLLKIKNYINGEFVDAVSGEWLDNYEPGTGKVFSKVTSSDAADIENAYQAAKAAFPGWKKTTVEQRSKYLYKIADVLETRLVCFPFSNLIPLL